MNTRFLILFLCLLIASMPIALANDNQFSAFNAEVERLASRHNVAGVSVAIVTSAQVSHLYAYGMENTSTESLMNTGTVMQAASISKPVAAWVVMSLVEKGLLDLDTPVSTYLRRWALPPSTFDNEGVTIRRLLSHTAGLSLGGYPGFPPDERRPSVANSLSGHTNGVGDVRLVMPPGAGWSYSGGGYTLLQLIVEEVTGQTFADYAEQAVLRPLGMNSSSYAPTDDLLSWSAQAHNSMGQPLPNYRFSAEAAAGLHTTASDLARFMIANMTNNPVLSRESVALMHTPAPASAHYGLGFMVRPGITVEHGGSNIGWKAHLAMIPETASGMVVLTNSDSGAHLLNDLYCYMNQHGDMPQFADACRTEAELAKWGRIILSALAGILILALLLVARRSRQPGMKLNLPPVPGVRSLLGTVTLIAIAGWVIFWHTTLGAYLVSGIPHTRAIDYVPSAIAPGSYLVVMILITLGSLSIMGTTAEDRPNK